MEFKIGDKVICNKIEGEIISVNRAFSQREACDHPIVVQFEDGVVNCFSSQGMNQHSNIEIAPQKFYVNVYGDGTYDDRTTDSLEKAIEYGNNTESYRFTVELVRVES